MEKVCVKGRVLGCGVVLVCMCLLMFVVSCAPRGETHSIDQILEANQTRFKSALENISTDAPRESVTKVAQQLQAFLSGDGASAKALANAIEDLTATAGFPTRPALAEVGEQFANFISQPRTEAQRKLLASRAYLAFSQELETTQFRVRMAS